MQKIDSGTIEELNIPSLVLMERAALSVYEVIRDRFQKGARCLVLAGSGNNGGDGLALARILAGNGYGVHVVLVGNHKTSEGFQAQMHMVDEILCRIPEGERNRFLKLDRVLTPEDASGWKGQDYDVVVDSIFGIGLSRELVSPEREVIETVNRMQAFRVAVDIPSGLDADSGLILGEAFLADVTVTFGYAKVGMYMADGPVCSGTVLVKDIGFPDIARTFGSPDVFTLGEEGRSLLPKRVVNSNKGTYGRVAVIAGCETMAGAAYFSAAAAYRSGAGLVKIYSHSANRDILLSRLPEAVYEAYDTAASNQEDAQTAAKQVVTSAKQFADVLVVGPGLGRSPMSEGLVKAALFQREVPVVLDADGLNILSEHKDWLESSRAELILTPHLKEMERLTNIPVETLRGTALDVAKNYAKEHGIVCVLKGAHTIVTDGMSQTYINITGNQGMSTGGTGDVLTGVIAAMSAGGLIPFQAAVAGVLMHGMAGDEAMAAKSDRALMAGDLLDGLCEVFLK